MSLQHQHLLVRANSHVGPNQRGSCRTISKKLGHTCVTPESDHQFQSILLVEISALHTYRSQYTLGPLSDWQNRPENDRNTKGHQTKDWKLIKSEYVGIGAQTNEAPKCGGESGSC